MTSTFQRQTGRYSPNKPSRWGAPTTQPDLGRFEPSGRGRLTGTPSGKQWIRIDLWHTTITLAVQDGSVVWVPRDAQWALGKPEQLVADHYRSEGAQFVRL